MFKSVLQPNNVVPRKPSDVKIDVPLVDFIRMGAWEHYLAIVDLINASNFKMTAHNASVTPNMIVELSRYIMGLPAEPKRAAAIRLRALCNCVRNANYKSDTHAPVPIKNIYTGVSNVKPDWTTKATRSSLKILSSIPYAKPIVELGSGRHPKSLLLVKNNPGTILYCVDSVAPVHTAADKQNVTLYHIKADMNKVILQSLEYQSYIFYSTLGHIRPKSLSIVRNKDVRGLIYISDNLLGQGPLFVSDDTDFGKGYSLRGRIGNFNVNERAIFFQDISSESNHLEPLLSFNTYDFPDRASASQFLVLPPPACTLSDYPSVSGNDVIIVPLKRDIGLAFDFDSRPRVYPASVSILDALFMTNTYITAKTDGVIMNLFHNSSMGHDKLHLADKHGNIYAVLMADRTPFVSSARFNNVAVEVVSTGEGPFSRLFVLPETTGKVIGANEAAISAARSAALSSNGALFFKPYKLIKPGRVIHFPAMANSDGMLFMPSMGSKTYYLKAVNTYDVMIEHNFIAGEPASNNVFEFYKIAGILYRGRVRYDKTSVDRLDKIEDVENFHNDGEGICRALKFQGKSDCKFRIAGVEYSSKVASGALLSLIAYKREIFGKPTGFVFSYDWAVNKNLYSYLRSIKYEPLLEVTFDAKIRELESWSVNTPINTNNFVIDKFSSAVVNALYDVGYLKMKFIMGIPNYYVPLDFRDLEPLVLKARTMVKLGRYEVVNYWPANLTYFDPQFVDFVGYVTSTLNVPGVGGCSLNSRVLVLKLHATSLRQSILVSDPVPKKLRNSALMVDYPFHLDDLFKELKSVKIESTLVGNKIRLNDRFIGSHK